MRILALNHVASAAIKRSSMNRSNMRLRINGQRHLIAVGKFGCQVWQRMAGHTIGMRATLRGRLGRGIARLNREGKFRAIAGLERFNS